MSALEVVAAVVALLLVAVSAGAAMVATGWGGSFRNGLRRCRVQVSLRFLLL